MNFSHNTLNSQTLHSLQYSEIDEAVNNETSIRHLREAAWEYYNLENILSVAQNKISNLYQIKKLDRGSFHSIDAAISGVRGFCTPVNMCLSDVITALHGSEEPFQGIPQPPKLNPATGSLGNIFQGLINYTNAAIAFFLDSLFGAKVMAPLKALAQKLINLVKVIQENYPPLLR